MIHTESVLEQGEFWFLGVLVLQLLWGLPPGAIVDHVHTPAHGSHEVVVTH